jgi:serine/threonine protein kinase
MRAIEGFIDFLKGILRIDKDQRWTPSMAMEHPFITREAWTGPFEPKRETSTHESQGADTMSEISSSSKDSREYKAGSCPSKILYP